MKFLVASDSHGALARIIQMIMTHPEIENIIFLGDGDRDIDDFMSAYEGYKYYIVSGNCDHISQRPDFAAIDTSKGRILYTHGHRFEVKNGLAKLIWGAKKLNAKVALYGHTHIQKIDVIDGVLYFNPGSIKNYEYGILEFNEKGWSATHYTM